MISMVHPDSMTSEERRLEVASILARGLLRRVRLARAGESGPYQKAGQESGKSLDLSAESRLSVAPQSDG